MRHSSHTSIDLQQLERISQEQKLIIQILCDAYNHPDQKNQIFNILSNSSLQANNSSVLRATNSSKFASDDDKMKRIQELERLIIEQDSAHAKLEQQLIEYNAKAQEYEDELAMNEKEKARLLASFQQSSNSISTTSNTSEHFKELEKRAQELADECNKARAKNDSAQALCGEIQNQLLQSQGQVKTLEKQVESTKNQLSISQNDPDLLQQIAEQEQTIERLTVELAQANEKIASMKRENQSLRDKLMNIDDSD